MCIETVPPGPCDECGKIMDAEEEYKSGNAEFCSMLCLFEFFDKWQQEEEDNG